jgi:hypothetical protein
MAPEADKLEPEKTKPAGEKPDYVWLFVKKLVASIGYLLEEGRLGFATVIFLTVFLNVKDIVLIFHFPPEDEPFAHFLIFGVAVAVWDITRARVAERKKELASETPQKLRRHAITGFVVSLVLFCCYYTISGNYVFAANADAKPAGNSIILQAPHEVFFCPIVAGNEFQTAISSQSGCTNYRRGFRFVVDNDANWLADKLDEEFWLVMTTKAALFFSIFLATGVLVWSSTITSFLEKAKPSID